MADTVHICIKWNDSPVASFTRHVPDVHLKLSCPSMRCAAKCSLLYEINGDGIGHLPGHVGVVSLDSTSPRSHAVVIRMQLWLIHSEDGANLWHLSYNLQCWDMYHTLSTLNSYESKVMARGSSTCSKPPMNCKQSHKDIQCIWACKKGLSTSDPFFKWDISIYPISPSLKYHQLKNKCDLNKTKAFWYVICRDVH